MFLVALTAVAALACAVLVRRSRVVRVPVDISHLAVPVPAAQTETVEPPTDVTVLREKASQLLEEIRPVASELVRFVELDVALRECSEDELSDLLVRIDAFHAALGSLLEQRSQVPQRRARVDEVAEMWRAKLREGRSQTPEESPARREMRSIFFG